MKPIMKPIHYILIFGTVILAMFIFFNWEKVKKLFSKGEEKKEPSEGDLYQECIKKNQSLPDGTPCSFCIKPGTSEIYEQGIIKDGKCVPVRTDVTPEIRYVPAILRVSNPAGAWIYILSGSIFQQTRGSRVPFGRQLRILQRANSPTQGTFYKTTSGWLRKNDVVI